MMRNLAIVLLLAITACSAERSEPLLKDRANWPLPTLKGIAFEGELPEDADRVLAEIKIGSYHLIAWIHPKGLCGLTQRGSWTHSTLLTESSGTSTTGEEGFAGPSERTALTMMQSNVIHVCTPTRMMAKIKTRETEVKLRGHASAQVGNGLVQVVVGTPEARRESLPQATVTGR